MDFTSAYIHSLTSSREMELRPRHAASVHVGRPPRARRLGRWARRAAAEPAWRGDLRVLVPGVSDAELDDVAGHVDVITIPAGRAIFQMGAPAQQAVVIRSGRAVETTIDGCRRELRPGSAVGIDELRSGTPADVTVRALTPVEAVVVYGPAFLALGADSRTAA